MYMQAIKQPVSVIHLDMDGTLVDLTGGVMRLFGAPTSLQTEIQGWDGMPRVLSEHLGREISTNQMWSTIEKAGVSFWENLEWLPWGLDLYYLCRDIAPVLLATTPTAHWSCVEGKRRWIKKHIPKERQKDVAFTGRKDLIAHPQSLLVDDGEHNIQAYAKAKGRVAMIPSPWNSAKRWTNYEEIKPIVMAAAGVSRDLLPSAHGV